MSDRLWSIHPPCGHVHKEIGLVEPIGLGLLLLSDVFDLTLHLRSQMRGARPSGVRFEAIRAAPLQCAFGAHRTS